MKKFLVLLITIAALLSLGCGRNPQMETMTAGRQRAMGMTANQAVYDIAYESAEWSDGKAVQTSRSVGSADDSTLAATATEFERKLVRTANVRMRVESLEAAEVTIENLLEKFNAYSASTSVDENSRHFSLRVPSHFYELFLEEMNGMGRLLHRFENTEDVTLRYYDLEGRLAARRELLVTYQSYLRRATNMEEILAVENRISELQFEIERVGTQLRNLANQVDYATIELFLVGPATVSPIQSVTFGERVKQLFGGFGGFLANVAFVLLGLVIYGIPVLILIGVLYWVLLGRIGLLKKLWSVIKK